MANEIDEVSKILGTLQADISYIRESVDKANGKIETLTRTTILQEQSIKQCHKRVDNVEPVIEEYEKYKNRSVGIVATLSVVFGVVGGVVLKFLDHWVFK